MGSLRSTPERGAYRDSIGRVSAGTLLWVTFSVIAGMFLGLSAAMGKPAEEVRPKAETCLVVDDFWGELQIMDAGRSRVIDPAKGAAIPCGGWVSVDSGWVKLAHRDGYKVHLGAGTFVQFPEGEERMVMLKGQAFAMVAAGSPDFRVMTANARARVGAGAALVVYIPSEQETQLSSLGGKSRLENRFKPTEGVEVRGGELTALNFKLERTIPSLPRAINAASLKAKLAELKVSGKEEQEAIKIAQARSARSFAAELKPSGGKMLADEDPKTPAGRSPASVGFGASHARSAAERERDAEEAESLQNMAYRRLAGGESAVSFIHPRAAASPKRKSLMEIVDPSARANSKRQAAEDQEKKRLIEELSRIRDTE